MRTPLRYLALIAAVATALSACAGPAPEQQRKEGSAMLSVSSPAFAAGGRIPTPYLATRAGGQNRSIPLAWTGVPEGAHSIAIVMIDEHPVARRWVHWAMFSVPTDVTSLPEGVSNTEAIPAGAFEVNNTAGSAGYSGPAAPPGTGEHEYVTTVYALDVNQPSIGPSPTAADIERSVSGHVLAQGSLTGVYGR